MAKLDAIQRAALRKLVADERNREFFRKAGTASEVPGNPLTKAEELSVVGAADDYLDANAQAMAQAIPAALRQKILDAEGAAGLARVYVHAIRQRYIEGV